MTAVADAPLIQPATSLKASSFGLDERREMYHLLARMPVAERISFVNWCAAKVAKKMKTTCRMNPKQGATASECYHDVMYCGEVYGIDLEEPMRELIRRAKNYRFGRR